MSPQIAMPRLSLLMTFLASLVIGIGIAVGIALVAAAHAEEYHGNVPEPLIGRWCNAWGDGTESGLYMRCKKSNIPKLVEAEGFVYTVKITQGSVIEGGRKCKGTDIHEWGDSLTPGIGMLPSRGQQDGHSGGTHEAAPI